MNSEEQRRDLRINRDLAPEPGEIKKKNHQQAEGEGCGKESYDGNNRHEGAGREMAD